MTATPADGPTICLAASGGGHVRQLLDLKPFWSAYPHFFVTEDTALGRSIAQQEETFFVPHFALGQARLGNPFKMIAGALRSAWRSLRIVWRRRPDYVLTTGAGSQLFIVLWARLLGARIILVDSFARFDSPSAFARLAGPLAHHRFSQSAKAGKAWGDAAVFDPLRALETPAPPKSALVFATVGATLPFPRLTQLVLQAKAEGVIEGDLVIQVGENAAVPDSPAGSIPDVRIVDTLPFEEVQELLAKAHTVICHGGTGSILTALRAHCRVIVIPREFERGEHYDNHQAEIAESFRARKLLQVAHDHGTLATALLEAGKLAPQPVTTDYSELADRLRTILANDGIASPGH